MLQKLHYVKLNFMLHWHNYIKQTKLHHANIISLNYHNCIVLHQCNYFNIIIGHICQMCKTLDMYI